jgi:hypothetical protein
MSRLVFSIFIEGKKRCGRLSWNWRGSALVDAPNHLQSEAQQSRRRREAEARRSYQNN